MQKITPLQNITPSADGVAPDERRDLSRSFASDRDAAPLATKARCYSFCIGPWSFLLEEGQFAELISQPVYTPLPNTPQHCLGLANVRGNIVPFYSLHVFVAGVQRPSREQLRYALLVGDTVDGVLLAIDGKPQAIERDQLMQAPRPTSMLGEPVTQFVQQAFRLEGRDWLMLDGDKLTQFLVSAGAE